MRNGFQERLVKGLKERGYHGKKADGWVYRVGSTEGEMLQLQDVRKRAAWERVYWERRDQEDGHWG